MSTLITGKSNLKASIQKTEIENLHFVSAGPTPPNPSELLLQKEFEDLLDQLRKQFDVIILGHTTGRVGYGCEVGNG